VTLIAGPQHGILALNPDGSFAYTPAPAFSGTDSFTYQDSDGLLTSNVATATITVTESAPVAVNDTYTVAHDQTLTGSNFYFGGSGILANDTDADHDALTATLVAGPQNGSLTFSLDGTFSYTPTPGFSGTDSFTYQASDGLLTSNVATATITVTPPSSGGGGSPPTDSNFSVTIAHDRTATGYLQPYGFFSPALTTTLVGNVQSGQLTLNSNGSYSYLPNPGFYGTDSFTYQNASGTLVGNVATVTITVVENAPLATGGSSSTPHDRTLNGFLGLSDADGDKLTIVVGATTQHGTLAIQPGGSYSGPTFSYVPNPGFYGTDSFTFSASDGLKSSAVVTETIAVTEHAPVSANDAYRVIEGGTLAATQPGAAGPGQVGGALANDTDAEGDKLTATLLTGVQHGSLGFNADGTFTYTPTAGYLGLDSFTYQATDGLLAGAAALVTLNVTEHAPTANADLYRLTHDTVLTVPAASGVLANDHDADGDPLTPSIVSSPQDGTLSLKPDGSFVYTPTAGFSGLDRFTYSVSDGLDTSNVATVFLLVGERAPVAINDAYKIGHDHLLFSGSNGVLANDTDAEGDKLTATLVVGPQHGKLTFASDGTFLYSPTPGFYGVDTFSYQSGDGLRSSNVATVTITVGESAPTATALILTSSGGAVVGSLASAEKDADADTLSTSLVGGVQHGSLTLNPNGSYTYIPNAGFAGIDSFSYMASDGLLSSNIATVLIHVAAPIAPAAADDFYTILEGRALNAYPGLLANDTYAAGSGVTVSLISGPQNGTLTLSPNGNFTYTPNSGFSGTDSFAYLDHVGAALTNTATATIVVLLDRQAPTADGSNQTVVHDQPLSIGLQGADPNNLTLAFAIVSGPQHGTLTLDSSGRNPTYTPGVGYVGADSFTFKVNDGLFDSNLATVSLIVVAVAPRAYNDSNSSTYGALISGNVQNNDLIATGSASGVAFRHPVAGQLTSSLVAGPAHGSLALKPDGTYTYTSTFGYVGTDSFTYRDGDGLNTSSVATVLLTINPITSLARNLSYPLWEAQSLTVSAASGLLANQPVNSPWTPSIVSNVQHGTLALNPDGSFAYTPLAAFVGTDSFTYQETDGPFASNVGTVSLVVSGIRSVNDTFSMVHDRTLGGTGTRRVSVLTNDVYSRDVATTALLVSDVQHGKLVLAPDGSFTYTPAPGYVGTDSFSYQFAEGSLTSGVATATITVVEHAPVANNGAFVDPEGHVLATASNHSLLVYASDADNDTLTPSVVTNVQYGTLTLNADGTFVYIPSATFVGPDSFTYQVTDGLLASNVATVTIHVSGTATTAPPKAVNDSYTVGHDRVLRTSSSASGEARGVQGNDLNPGGSPLTSTVVANPLHGSLTLSPDGNFAYTPNPGYVGADSFTYQDQAGSLLIRFPE